MIIPEYNRRRLASSVVGTPGVDDSGQRIANTVAQTANNVATISGDILQARKVAMDKAVAFDNSLTYEIEMEKASKLNADEFAAFDGDPIVVAEALREKGINARDRIASTMTSPEAKAQFLNDAGNSLNSRFKSELKRASENQVKIGAERIVSANNKLATQAYELFKNDQMPYDLKINTLKTLGRARLENVRNSVAIVGLDESIKLDKSSSEGLAKAAYSGFMESTPADAVKLLKEPGVREALGAEYDAKLEAAKTRASDFKEIIKDREYETLVVSNSQHLEAIRNGAGLDYIEAIPDGKVRRAFMDRYLDAKPLDPEEIAVREARLLVQFKDFFEPAKVDGRIQMVVKKDKRPQDIVELQLAYIKNAELTRGRGQLTKSIDKYSEILLETIKNGQPSGFAKVFLGALNAFESVGRAFTGKVPTKKGAPDVAAAVEESQMAAVFFDKISKIDVNNLDQVQAAVQSTIQAHQTMKNPNRAKYLIGDTIQTPKGLVEVYGYDDDGEPLVKGKK